MRHFLSERLWGKVEVTEPVIGEILATRAMQRLKGVDQAGYYEPYMPGTAHSRFEHSVGVYYLLRRFGAPLDEQVSGLIHDVSHAVFSHCIDYAGRGGSESRQDWQDRAHGAYVLSSDIAPVLRRHGFSIRKILDDRRHPLKERKLPDLCADRLDYSLRSAFMYRIIPAAAAFEFLDRLVIRDQNWVFTSGRAALSYARLFLKLNRKFYSGLASAVMFRTVGDAVSAGLGEGIITDADLFRTDSVVLAKLRAAKDSGIMRLLRRMDRLTPVKRVRSGGNAAVTVKSRVVDPLYLYRGRIRRLSDGRPDYVRIIRREMKPKFYRFLFRD
ncbi:hypothetical protein A2Z33_01685 [Candidatus Gottesmanbacteria bacterium RBG_16_52_11]|uniref:HD/PDEase domain-containing protein n=1 Tax=Candidatus Gottesmanbacteria bacterium RBG_16_52_11 TaxID=1798374 RepID=A0A1F5YP12_9BACT|nr:MAG: hypothetical protein A2Z33_01685 [Candidatus Gottesmanbacteria bacterium RBG_16_52_11]